MVDNAPIHGPGNLPVQGVGGATGRERAPREDAKAIEGGVAFQALLDRLRAQAQELSRESERVDRPEDLPEAMDRAQESLQDALALRDRLLEAYRQARQSGADGAPPSAI